MNTQWSSLAERVLFATASVLAGLALWERLANALGRTTLVGSYVPTPSRLLELAAIALLFVIALVLREIKQSGRGGGSQG